MRRIDVATAAAAAPAVPAAGTEGFFTNGNPGGGVPATVIPDWFLNMLQEELRAVVVAGGLTPSKTVWTQLRDALAVLYGGGGSLGGNGWQRLPGGLIVQWGLVTTPTAAGQNINATQTVTLPTTFPTGALRALVSLIHGGIVGTGWGGTNVWLSGVTASQITVTGIASGYAPTQGFQAAYLVLGN
ncbi:gp53-like domain-containing protein [Falsiroseomonas sp. CW058]|uniref:gp53-like domain-containing protein n=1 Tax=Falsiroseomonas sp. CW058 TaxID=3388664 RepID=UPI003D31E64A